MYTRTHQTATRICTDGTAACTCIMRILCTRRADSSSTKCLRSLGAGRAAVASWLSLGTWEKQRRTSHRRMILRELYEYVDRYFIPGTWYVSSIILQTVPGMSYVSYVPGTVCRLECDFGWKIRQEASKHAATQKGRVRQIMRNEEQSVPPRFTYF